MSGPDLDRVREILAAAHADADAAVRVLCACTGGSRLDPAADALDAASDLRARIGEALALLRTVPHPSAVRGLSPPGATTTPTTPEE